MQRATVSLCCVLIAAASAPAAGAEAAPRGAWQAPQAVSRPTAFIFEPRLGFDRRGNGLASWTANAGRRTFDDPSRGPGRASSRWSVELKTGWQRERATARALTAVVPYGRLRAMAVTHPADGSLAVVFIDLDRGRVWRTQTLDRGADRIDGVAIDVSENGEAVIAWSRVADRRHQIVAAEAPAGRPRFGHPRQLSPLGAVSPRVDVNARGDAVVAWQRNGAIEARVRRAGRSFERTARVGTTANGYSMSAAVGAGGRAAVAWTSQDVCCGDGAEPTEAATLLLAYASPTGRFRPARQIDRFASGGANSPQVVFDGTASGTVAWTTGSQGDVRAARFERGIVAAPQAVAVNPGGSNSGVRLVRLAADPGGGTVLAWIRGDIAFNPLLPTTLMSALSGGSTGFAPAEQVSPSDHDVAHADVAPNPRTGRAQAIWSRDRGGANGRVLYGAERR